MVRDLLTIQILAILISTLRSWASPVRDGITYLMKIKKNTSNWPKKIKRGLIKSMQNGRIKDTTPNQMELEVMPGWPKRYLESQKNLKMRQQRRRGGVEDLKLNP